MFALGTVSPPETKATSTDISQYYVTIQTDGAAEVFAVIHFPVPREVIHDILTDYQNWPDLFPSRPRIKKISHEQKQVIVDMVVPALFFPMELDLTTSTTEPTPFFLQTQLVRGDFERYERLWTLNSTQNGTQTEATLVLRVLPSIWTPQWLFREVMDSEIRGHLRKIQEHPRVKEHSTQLHSTRETS